MEAQFRLTEVDPINEQLQPMDRRHGFAYRSRTHPWLELVLVRNGWLWSVTEPQTGSRIDPSYQNCHAMTYRETLDKVERFLGTKTDRAIRNEIARVRKLKAEAVR